MLETAGKDVLQYSTSEGYGELREWIVNRYKAKNISVNADNVLITTGSQQGLDLLGKTFLNEGDNVVIEEPGYLGAIQAFSIYRSTFFPVPVTPEGMVTDLLAKITNNHLIKLIYCVPNFQNPSGISYSERTGKRSPIF